MGDLCGAGRYSGDYVRRAIVDKIKSWNIALLCFAIRRTVASHICLLFINTTSPTTLALSLTLSLSLSRCLVLHGSVTTRMTCGRLVVGCLWTNQRRARQWMLVPIRDEQVRPVHVLDMRMDHRPSDISVGLSAYFCTFVCMFDSAQRVWSLHVLLYSYHFFWTDPLNVGWVGHRWLGFH